MEGVLKIHNYRLLGILSCFLSITLAMGYVPLAMGYDVLFVDTRTFILLYTDLPTCVLVEVAMT